MRCRVHPRIWIPTTVQSSDQQHVQTSYIRAPVVLRGHVNAEIRAFDDPHMLVEAAAEDGGWDIHTKYDVYMSHSDASRSFPDPSVRCAAYVWHARSTPRLADTCRSTVGCGLVRGNARDLRLGASV